MAGMVAMCRIHHRDQAFKGMLQPLQLFVRPASLRMRPSRLTDQGHTVKSMATVCSTSDDFSYGCCLTITTTFVLYT